MESVPETINVFQENSSSRKSVSSKKSSDPGLKEIFSVFGDNSCGEPLSAQHIIIDFTPNKEIDTDYAQNKCCEFWNFIDSIPEIQNLMVLPEISNNTRDSDGENITIETDNTETEERKEEIDKTAISTLELVEEKGLINRIFEAKLPQSNCSLDSREYKEEEEPPRFKKLKKTVICSEKYNEQCVCQEPCGRSTMESANLKSMIKAMEEWDLKHPKSMEPPGHSPDLQHCVLQRLKLSHI